MVFVKKSPNFNVCEPNELVSADAGKAVVLCSLCSAVNG